MSKKIHKVVQLIPIGDEWGIEIDEAMMKLLEVDENTEFEETIEGKSLILRPVKPSIQAPSKP